jgi:hypothetical protein
MFKFGVIIQNLAEGALSKFLYLVDSFPSGEGISPREPIWVAFLKRAGTAYFLSNHCLKVAGQVAVNLAANYFLGT